MPATSIAQELYDTVEQVRVESIGAKYMTGVANNLDAALEERCRSKGFSRVTEREQVPIAEAVGLLAREAITGRQPPPSARQMLDLWRPFIESKAGPVLNELEKSLYDQAKFQDVVRKIITDLGFSDDEMNASQESDGAEGENQESGEGQQDGENETEGDSSATDGTGEQQEGDEQFEETDMLTEDGDGELQPGSGEEDPEAVSEIILVLGRYWMDFSHKKYPKAEGSALRYKGISHIFTVLKPYLSAAAAELIGSRLKRD